MQEIGVHRAEQLPETNKIIYFLCGKFGDWSKELDNKYKCVLGVYLITVFKTLIVNRTCGFLATCLVRLEVI